MLHLSSFYEMNFYVFIAGHSLKIINIGLCTIDSEFYKLKILSSDF